MTTPDPQQALSPAQYAASQAAFKALPVAQQAAMLSRPGNTGPVVDERVAPWQEATAGRLANGRISGRCLPEQDEKVRLRLASGAETQGQLTWAYRWLLQGGGVKWLQEVTHWRPL